MRQMSRRLLPVLFRPKPLVAQDARYESGETGEEVDHPIRIDTGGRLRQAARKADPAPSRLAWRIQRLMLTPGIRLGLRFGVPFCLTLAVTSAFLANEERRDALRAFVADTRASIQERPEFMVKLLAIDGAGPNLDADIREVVSVDFPISSFELDVERIRDVVTGLDPVKTAAVRVRPGGILQIDVEERQPVMLWRTRNGLEMLDETGAHVDNLAARADRPDLPLMAGQGANTRVDEALALFRAAAPLGERLRGIERIGERRWDIVLDRDQRIQLPTTRPVQALERVLAVSEVQDLLERDVAVVDMRISNRPTIRMSEAAVTEWWRMKAAATAGRQ
ncbi:cell division protein FtsQ/DivIB [Lutimaribacter marinistellae]|uniref:Cell division protein FtsQ n=1 Tax=Lutimaribacter marinistellae TaxID=1820329 RepID=A0ABV7TIX4_9RHOB